MASNTAISPKQVVRRYVKALTSGTTADLARWAAADIKATQGFQSARGMAALEHYAMTYRQQVQGWKIELGRMIAEGNWVSAVGMATGEVGGVPTRLPFFAHYRVARGKVAEVVMAADASQEVKPEAKVTAAGPFPLKP